MSRQVTMITGASRGIGRAMATRFAQSGSAIIGVARRREELRETMADLERRFGTPCLALEGDIAEPNAVEDIFTKALQSFPRIDVLINNAAVGEFDEFTRLTDDAWRAMIEVNLMGAVFCTRQALKSMREGSAGMIVNVSSICGLGGFAQCSAYCASKFALVGFSDSLAKETAGFRIPVYAVCPDIVDTGFAGNRNASLTRPEKMLTAEEVAAFIHGLTVRRPPSQICSLRLHPLTALFSRLGLRLRKISAKRIRWI